MKLGRGSTKHSTDQRMSVRLDRVEPEKVRWLWSRRIPFGKVTILDGDPEVGKSLLTMDLAARVSTGRKFPFLRRTRPPGNVLILSAEDDAKDTIVPRLIASGADRSRIHLMKPEIPTSKGDRPLSIPEDIPRLEAEILRCKTRLVIFDPLVCYISAKINTWSDQQTRRALTPLVQMAVRTGAAILVVRHLNKKVDLKALYRGGGSMALIGAPRSGLLLARDPHDPETRVLVRTKSNISRQPRALAFLIVKAENGNVKILWLGRSDWDADSLLGASTPKPQSVAMSFLRRILRCGPRPEKEVRRLAEGEGIALRTLVRAKGFLGVKSRRKGRLAGKGYWLWSLPGKPSE